VFVNLFAERRGQALSYPAVYGLVVRLRKRTGIDFDAHWFRHAMATRMLRDGVPVEVVSKLFGAWLGDHDPVRLWPPDRGGPTAGAGGGRLVHRKRGDLVTGPVTTRPAGLLAKLMAVVRPGFRSDVLVFDPRDPVFGGPACAVPGCVRAARAQGLCPGHHQRWWRTESKPPLVRLGRSRMIE
jgi:hypothetical protein